MEYYNNNKLNKAIKNIKRDPFNSEIMLREYLDEYPMDYFSYTHYIYNLIIIGKLDDAIELLHYLETKCKYDRFFERNYLRKEKLLNDIVILKYRILAQEGDYEQLYDYYKNTFNTLDKEFENITYYCQKKLGLLNENRDNKRYTIRQIINYHEDDFFKHIRKHISDFSDNNNLFYSNFPIDSVINEVKSIIPSDKNLSYGIFEDTYVFKYDDCGRDGNRITNYFIVVCFHNTNELITALPVYGIENCPYTNLNFLKKENKIKILSQTDKFNMRLKKRKI